MNSDPKLDIKFQTILKGICDGISFTVGGVPPLAPNPATIWISDDSVRKIISELLDLRFSFVIAVWARGKRSHPEVQESYTAFRALRDSKEAQAFLVHNPYFFTEFDRAIYRDMKSTVDDLRAGPATFSS
jgi:hypothetical protein